MKRIRDWGFFKEFREFINQGNAMDLAIGVVIGTAFSAIVTSLVNDIIMPLISLVAGGTDFANLSITIPNLFGEDTAAVIKYGNFIQNVVNFLLIAFSLFIMIRFVNRIHRRAQAAAKKAGEKLGIKKDKNDEKSNKDSTEEDVSKATAEQTKLLKEILKELKKSNKK